MIVSAPAKLNLSLRITGRRDDGYHLLESLVAFTEFGDRLELEAAEALSLTVVGAFAAALTSPPPVGGRPGGGQACSTENVRPLPNPPPKREGIPSNLVIRAARLLQSHTCCNAGARITLHKHIPIGAGLGGGSADAAAALRGLMRLWDVKVEDDALRDMALRLGSDVPACLASQTAWMTGIGEKLTPVTLELPMGVVLVNPRIPLPTADVFRRFSGKFAAPSQIPDSFEDIRASENMLQVPAQEILPVIGELLSAIGKTSGCRLSRMSGSGATCFGLYDNEAAAQAAAIALQRDYSHWWCVATKFLGNYHETQ